MITLIWIVSIFICGACIGFGLYCWRLEKRDRDFFSRDQEPWGM